MRGGIIGMIVTTIAEIVGTGTTIGKVRIYNLRSFFLLQCQRRLLKCMYLLFPDNKLYTLLLCSTMLTCRAT